MENSPEMQKALKDLERVTGITFQVGADSEADQGEVLNQIQLLTNAYREKYNKSNFIQNLLLGQVSQAEMYGRARKLHVDTEGRRVIFAVETKYEQDTAALETLQHLFTPQTKDYIVQVGEKLLILIKHLRDKDIYEEMGDVANMIVDMVNAEAMSQVRVSYSTVCNELKDLSRGYKEAKLAIEVGHIFYAERTVIPYGQLGIGRLIYQLPVPLCKMFMQEVFGEQLPDTFDEETIVTINKFFENNLNISETARQLYVHRNTLVYRLEKLEKDTGLDIRKFDDALTFKIATMVVNYMKFRNEEDKL